MEAERDPLWLCQAGAVVGTLLVGCTGLLPLLIIPLQVKTEEGARKLRLLLSFAVGGLLGDVFLHLLPESYSLSREGHLVLGLWVLGGMLSFLVIEKIFEFTDDDELVNNNKGEAKKKKIVGYLNLLANCVDNFVHGLAVASSFLTSFKLGLVTTFAILIHEIPHEIGDFAILLKSGFSRWQAGKAQLFTASIGLFGAYSALSMDSVDDLEEKTTWILPFTAGGFLNIALVSVLPELMEEQDPREALKQVFFVLLGIGVMALLSLI